jgi:hypothetical protein
MNQRTHLPILISRLRLAASVVIAGALLSVPAGSLAANHPLKPTNTFKGRTSQGKTIVVEYFKTSSHRGKIRFITHVVGNCPVQGVGFTTMSQKVDDFATGGWPIRSAWSFETQGPSYDIKISAKGAKRLTGKLRVSWTTNITNAPTCTTPLITWTAKR